MSVRIEFIQDKKELTLPVVKLTKSRNGKTGTATFIFLQPSLFVNSDFQIDSINGMYLIWENNKIETNDIEIIFKNGKPYLIRALLIFKNSKEWFHFLNFMNYYSKETGLSFN